MFIFGIIICYLGGYEETKPPHDVWLGENGAILVVQKPGSNVYHFGRNSDGSYDFVASEEPKKRERRLIWVLFIKKRTMTIPIKTSFTFCSVLAIILTYVYLKSN